MKSRSICLLLSVVSHLASLPAHATHQLECSTGGDLEQASGTVCRDYRVYNLTTNVCLVVIAEQGYMAYWTGDGWVGNNSDGWWYGFAGLYKRLPNGDCGSEGTTLPDPNEAGMPTQLSVKLSWYVEPEWDYGAGFVHGPCSYTQLALSRTPPGALAEYAPEPPCQEQMSTPDGQGGWLVATEGYYMLVVDYRVPGYRSGTVYVGPWFYDLPCQGLCPHPNVNPSTSTLLDTDRTTEISTLGWRHLVGLE